MTTMHVIDSGALCPDCTQALAGNDPELSPEQESAWAAGDYQNLVFGVPAHASWCPMYSCPGGRGYPADVECQCDTYNDVDTCYVCKTYTYAQWHSVCLLGEDD